MPRNVTRDVKPAVQYMLWGKAAGRCEFAGCNQRLWKSSVTQEQVNIAQKAHIYSFSDGGPRGNKGIPKRQINNLANLMLVCHACHRKIDKYKDGGRYTSKLLREWKAEHERRIEIVTGIHPDRNSHILFYGANIGEINSPLSFNSAAIAMFPDRYPADDKAIELSTINSSFEDRDKSFYRFEDYNLITKFGQRVSERLAERNIRHMSMFALAPQPLLIRLGSLLTDVNEIQVYTRSREPQSWAWRRRPPNFKFIVRKPKRRSGPPALVLSLSACINDARVKAVLGKRVTLWKVTVPQPHNDFLKSKSQLRDFRNLARNLMVSIKNLHGQNEMLSIFPAAPAAIAVELGRIRQPKADMPWCIYDQVNDRGGFIPALTLPQTLGGKT